MGFDIKGIFSINGSQASTQLKQIGQQADQAGRQLNKMSGVLGGIRGLGDFGDILGSIGGGLAGAFTAAVAAMAAFGKSQYDSYQELKKYNEETAALASNASLSREYVQRISLEYVRLGEDAATATKSTDALFKSLKKLRDEALKNPTSPEGLLMKQFGVDLQGGNANTQTDIDQILGAVKNADKFAQISSLRMAGMNQPDIDKAIKAMTEAYDIKGKIFFPMAGTALSTGELTEFGKRMREAMEEQDRLNLDADKHLDILRQQSDELKNQSDMRKRLIADQEKWNVAERNATERSSKLQDQLDDLDMTNQEKLDRAGFDLSRAEFDSTGNEQDKLNILEKQIEVRKIEKQMMEAEKSLAEKIVASRQSAAESLFQNNKELSLQGLSGVAVGTNLAKLSSGKVLAEIMREVARNTRLANE